MDVEEDAFNMSASSLEAAVKLVMDESYVVSTCVAILSMLRLKKGTEYIISLT